MAIQRERLATTNDSSPEERAQALFNQASVRLEKKAYHSAHLLFHRALAIFEEIPGDKPHPQVIHCYERLATIAHAEGKIPEMAAYAQAALSPHPRKRDEEKLNNSK